MSSSVAHTRRNWMGNSLIALLAIAIWAFVAVMANRSEDGLSDSEYWTGYSLFGLFLLLAAFNLRKRLSVIPIGRAFWWHQLHVFGGILAIALFYLHVDEFWPQTGYQQLLAATVYLLLLSGIFGYLIQTVFPVKLMRNRKEIVFERIPDAIAEIREEVRKLTIDATEQLDSETLARFHNEAMDWYFSRPRFVIDHLLGGQLARYWIIKHFSVLERYTSTEEQQYITRLRSLAHRKMNIDQHYSLQGAMKLWLLFHVPTAMAALVLIFWHLLLVNIYSL